MRLPSLSVPGPVSPHLHQVAAGLASRVGVGPVPHGIPEARAVQRRVHPQVHPLVAQLGPLDGQLVPQVRRHVHARAAQLRAASQGCQLGISLGVSEAILAEAGSEEETACAISPLCQEREALGHDMTGPTLGTWGASAAGAWILVPSAFFFFSEATLG